VSWFTVRAIAARYRGRLTALERGPMENRAQIAEYAGTMAKELCALCRREGLNDLANIFEVAASEAAKVDAALVKRMALH